MSVLGSLVISLAGLTPFVALALGGSYVKNALGDSIYNTFVFIAVITGLYGASVFFNLLNEVFGSFWIFNVGEYGSLSLIFIIIIAKLLNWF